MSWTCANCGVTIHKDLRYPVRCSCGHVDRGSSLQYRPSTRVAWWEASLRLNECKQCQAFIGNGAHRCKYIEMGCSRSFKTELHSVTGKCPHGKWRAPEIPWITTARLITDAIALAQVLPDDIARVVGVPRSGMLPASAIATFLHAPLCSIINNEIVEIGHGCRMNSDQRRSGRTLIVDDTCASGHAMRQLDSLRDSSTLTAAVYCTHTAGVTPDFIGQYLPLPHLLEWNLFCCGYMLGAGVDLDGVICRNPPYACEPLYLPRFVPVRAIITARPESQRPQTEQWLARWGVKYTQLVMWPGSEESRDGQAVADYKAKAVREMGCDMYIESEVGLANLLRARGIRVLCPQEGWLR